MEAAGELMADEEKRANLLPILKSARRGKSEEEGISGRSFVLP